MTRRALLWLAACCLSGLCIAEEIDIDRSAKIPVSGGTVAATIFKMDATRVRVAVWPGFRVAALAGIMSKAISVQEAVNKLVLLKISANEILLVNGGFSTSEPDHPSGLLVSGGKVLSIPSYAKVLGNPASSCPVLQTERYRLSGLLCVRRDGTLTVGAFDENTWNACYEALQVEPVLVGPKGSVAVCPSGEGEDKYYRTAVCTSKEVGPNMQLKVVVTNDPISLFELATWMTKRVSAGGLGCEDAINFSGDTSTGAAYQPPPITGSLLHRPISDSFGAGTYPLASFLVIEGRK